MRNNIIALVLSLGLHIAFISTLYLASIKQENKEVKTISLLHVSLETYQKEEEKIEEIKKEEEKIKPEETKILKNEKQKVIPKAKPFVQQEEKKLVSLVQNDDTNTSHHLDKEVITTPSEPQAVNYQDDFIKENLTLITKAIEKNKNYPLQARKKHIEGIVEVAFTLSKNCQIIDIQATNSVILLQEAAIATIEKAQSEFPCPHETLTIHIPMAYTLK